MISPHYDRHSNWKPSNEIAGFRKGWMERMIANCPTGKAARAGYIAMLYALRAESMPGAFLRDAGIADFQHSIDCIIAALTK